MLHPEYQAGNPMLQGFMKTRMFSLKRYMDVLERPLKHGFPT